MKMSSSGENVATFEEREFTRRCVGGASLRHLDRARCRALRDGDEHALGVGWWLAGRPFHVVNNINGLWLFVIVDQYDVGHECITLLHPVSSVGFSITLGV